MTKERARDILSFQFTQGVLPIFDCLMYRHSDESIGIFEEYTFRQLLCIAYDLKEDNELTEIIKDIDNL